MNEEPESPDADAPADVDTDAGVEGSSKAAREAAQLAEEFLESLRRGDAGLDSVDEELAHDVLDLDRGAAMPLEVAEDRAAPDAGTDDASADDESAADAGAADPAVAVPSKRAAKGVPMKVVAEIESRAQAAEAKVAELTEENDAHYQARLRLQADFENYRKRVTREREEAQAYAHEDLVKELLPTIDNLERALEHAEAEEITGPVVEGVQITLNQALHVLSKFGVVPFESAGEPFDPQLHDAMSQIETDEIPPGHVASQFVKGYHYRERLLRPAMVAVAMAPPSCAGAEAAAPEGSGSEPPTEEATTDEPPTEEATAEPSKPDETAEAEAPADTDDSDEEPKG